MSGYGGIQKRKLSIVSIINYSADDCQSPDNCSKHHRFGGHAASINIGTFHDGLYV